MKRLITHQSKEAAPFSSLFERVLCRKFPNPNSPKAAALLAVLKGELRQVDRLKTSKCWRLCDKGATERFYNGYAENTRRCAKRKTKLFFPFGCLAYKNSHVLIADGIFSGIALYKSTKRATAVGFGASNIALIAKTIRLKFPEIDITICPNRKVNGIRSKYFSQIETAASDIGAFVAYPFADYGSHRFEICKTFFDVYAKYGEKGVDDNVFLGEHGFPCAGLNAREVHHG